MFLLTFFNFQQFLTSPAWDSFVDYNVYIGDVQSFTAQSGPTLNIASALSGTAKTYLVQVESFLLCSSANRDGATSASESSQFAYQPGTYEFANLARIF